LYSKSAAQRDIFAVMVSFVLVPAEAKSASPYQSKL